MNRKNTFTRASLIAAVALTVNTVQAQDIHFTQFTAAPLTVNPAFTGNFDGQWRATAIYRSQWGSITKAYQTYGASFDMPIIQDLTIDDYLAAGVQLFNDKAGDGNLSNFSGLVSVAYHKFLGGGSEPNKALSIGFQGGYTSKSIDLSKLYFGDEFYNGQFMPGTGSESLNNKVQYFTVNAGISWSHATSENFSYAIGVGANNLNQPQESLEKKKSSDVGLGIRYTAQAGAIWYVNEKFSIRPALLYQNQSTANEFVGGSEFNMIVGNPEIRSFATNVFLGAWYRTGDATMITGGMEFKGIRVGVSYDYNVSELKNASNGNGAFEISLRYIAPNPLNFARKLIYPCSRF